MKAELPPCHVITLADGTTMAFRCIPACPEGFLMGSRGYSADEEPIHRVVIEEDFWMAETPVTQDQLAVWIKQAGVKHENFHKGSGDLPAEQITWHQANEYCEWLTTTFQDQFPDGIVAAELPCEAYWEYACRGGKATEYHSGDGEAALREVGWYDSNSHYRTHAVGTASGPDAANSFGLYDMQGNVLEWCLDRWDDSAYRRRWDGITARETLLLAEEFGNQSEDPLRVVRGGSNWDSAARCRSAFRFRSGAGSRFWDYGFRVCLVRSPLGQPASASPERTASERRDGAEGAGSGGEAEILDTSFRDR